RRQLLGAGLAVLGVEGLVLRADAAPTPQSGSADELPAFVFAQNPAPPAREAELVPTEDNILGPYYRKGAPFRAKVTPPLEAGTVLLIAGRVWGHDTKKPLAGAVLDVWQANADGRYDNDDPDHPPAGHLFKNRSRLITDEAGY